MVTQHSAWYE